MVGRSHRLHLRRRAGALAGLAITSASLALAGAATAAGPAAAQTRPAALHSCSLSGRYESLGPTYVETLKVNNTTCATGYAVVKAYNACRVHHGGVKGTCHSPVLGFTCLERRTNSPVQFIGAVSCTKGRAQVQFTYSQNT